MGTSFSFVSSFTSELKRITSDFLSYVSGQSATFPCRVKYRERDWEKFKESPIVDRQPMFVLERTSTSLLLPVSLSVCLSTYLSICSPSAWSVRLSVSVHLFVLLSACLSYLSAYMPVCLRLSVCSPICRSVRPYVCFSAYLSVCPPICLSVCPPICLSL